MHIVMLYVFRKIDRDIASHSTQSFIGGSCHLGSIEHDGKNIYWLFIDDASRRAEVTPKNSFIAK